MKIIIDIVEKNGKLEVNVTPDETNSTPLEIGVGAYLSTKFIEVVDEMYDGADELARKNGVRQ